MDNILLALRVVVSLGVVIGAIWFVQRRMSRGGIRSKRVAKPISVVARQNLGPKASVAVVEFGGKRFLLGVTEHGISVLDNAPADEPAPVEVPALAAAPVVAASEPAGTRSASSRQNSRDFAHALDQASETPSPAKPAVVRLAKNDTFGGAFVPSTSKLSGSILSAATWKQAWIAVRGRS